MMVRASPVAPGNRPCFAKNSIMKRSKSHGCSIWQAWPAPGNVLNSQFGMRACSSNARTARRDPAADLLAPY
jgi:hypothetical protein